MQKFNFKKLNWKKLLIIFTIVTVIFGGLFAYVVGMKKVSGDSFLWIDREKYNTVGERLEKGDFLEKEVDGDYGMCGLAVKLGTYEKQQSGSLVFTVSDENRELLQDQSFPLDKVGDCEWFNVLLPHNQPSAVNEKFKVKIAIKDGDDAEVCVFSSSEGDDFSVLPLRIDNSKWKYKEGFLIFLYIVTLTWTICVFGFNVSTAKAFLIMGICQILLFNLVLPPISVPDEGVHFCTTYNYSNKLFGEKPEVLEEIEGYKSAYNISARPRDAKVWKEICDNAPRKENYVNIYRGLKGICGWEKEACDSYPPVIKGVILDIGPICYLPGIIGVSLARLLGLSGVMMIYLGRFCMGAAYLTLAYFGIKKMPFNKSTLALVALLPMSLHLAASYSYDCVLIGFSIFWTGLIFHYAFEKELLKWYDFVAIGVSAFVLSCGKGIYAILLALVLLIPSKKLGGKLKYTFFLLGFAALGALSVFLNIGTRMGGYVGANAVTEKYTLSYIFTDFIRFVFRSVYTVFQKLEFYLETMIGIRLGWLEIMISRLFVLPVIILFFLSTTKNREDHHRLTGYNRTVLIGLFLVVFAICLVAAMCWTNKTSFTFEGFQGRYLLPVLPLLLIGMRNEKWITLNKDIDKNLMGIMSGMNVLVLLSAFNTVVSR